MKTKSILVIAGIAILAAACGKKEKASSEGPAQATAKETNEALKVVLTGYFEVKDALVGDDAVKAKDAAAALAASSGDYSNELNEYAEAIAGSEDIEEQRIAFEALSVSLYDLAKEGGAGITIYKQYCPMAFDDKGAFWLSDNKKILNPYFGASMLRCGSVKEEIK